MSRWAVRSGDRAVPVRDRVLDAVAGEDVEGGLGVDGDARPADVHVDPAPVVVPPVGSVGEDRSGGEVGALLEADRLERRDEPVQVAAAGPARRRRSTGGPRAQARQHGGPLEVQQVDASRRRRASGRWHGPGAREPRQGPACPPRRRSPSWAHRASRRPGSLFGRTARSDALDSRHDVADFVRLSRAYVWVLIGCTVLGSLADDREDHAGPGALLRHLVGPGARRQRDVRRARSRATPTWPRTRPTSTRSSSRRRRSPRRSSTSSASTCRPQAIAGRFSASVDADVNSLTVTAIGTTPEEARDLANAVVDAVVVVRPGGRDRRAIPSSRHADHPARGGAASRRAVHARLRKAAINGAVGGLALAYAFLIARRLIDRRVRSTKHVEDATGASVLGIIPKEEALGRDHRGVRGDLGRAAEAFRQLRTNLRFVDVDNEPRKIVVTSALAGRGQVDGLGQHRSARRPGRNPGAAHRRRPAPADDRHHVRDRRRRSASRRRSPATSRSATSSSTPGCPT